jgi:hypothetical protein
MLDAAVSHLALGESETARALIRDAEKVLPANPVRQSDKEYKQRVLTRIGRLHDQLAKQSK